MKENIKIHLEEILHSGDVQVFRNEVKVALTDEIMAIEAPTEDKNKFIEVIELFDLPIKISNRVICEDKNEDKVTRALPLLAASISGVVFSTLLRRLPLITSAILSIGGANVVGCLVDRKVTGRNEPTKVSLEQSIDSPISEIARKIDIITNMVKLLLTPNTVLLNETYPNIIKWYQEAYASCDEFGQECSTYFKKRIEKVLNQCCYTLHNYDGTNSQLFTIDKDVNIQNVIQTSPAITNEKGYILPGSLSIPTDYKI